MTLSSRKPPAEPWDLWMLVGPRADGKTYMALDALPRLLGQGETAIVVGAFRQHVKGLFDEFERSQRNCIEGVNQASWVFRLKNGAVVRLGTVDEFLHDHRHFGMRAEIALLDEVSLYARDANRVAAELRVTCRVHRVITTSGETGVPLQLNVKAHPVKKRRVLEPSRHA